MKKDKLKLRGYLEYCLRDAATGKVIKKGKTHNTVTCWGRGWALAKLTPASDSQVMSSIAIGSVSAVAPASNQSALQGYMTIRNFGTTGLTSATNTACTFMGAVSFNTNETWSGSSQIGEFAIYNSSATGSGAMFNRVITATYINFATSNTLAISISITN
jgi:hypothetical protein